VHVSNVNIYLGVSECLDGISASARHNQARQTSTSTTIDSDDTGKRCKLAERMNRPFCFCFRPSHGRMRHVMTRAHIQGVTGRSTYAVLVHTPTRGTRCVGKGQRGGVGGWALAPTNT